MCEKPQKVERTRSTFVKNSSTLAADPEGREVPEVGGREGERERGREGERERAF